MAIRYFYDRVKKRLVMNPSALIASMKEKSPVVNVVHWHDADGREEALEHAANTLREMLLAGYWGSSRIALYGCLVFLFLWWLPFGWRGDLGTAYWILQLLPCALLLMGMWNCAKTLFLLFRLPSFMRRVNTAKVRMSASCILPPATLLTETKTPSPRKQFPAIILALVVFFVIFGTAAVPPPKSKVMIHRRDGTTTVGGKIRRVAFGEWWEIVPRHVEGKAYGYIYFNEEAGEILCLTLTYKLDNKQDYPKREVGEKMAFWALNLVQHFMSYAMGGMPPELSEDEKVEWLAEVMEQEEVLQAIKKQVQNAADEILNSRFVTLDVGIEVISLSKYQKEARRYR